MNANRSAPAAHPATMNAELTLPELSLSVQYGIAEPRLPRWRCAGGRAARWTGRHVTV